MKEIWSDVMCPFCYIGKRRFENALQQFEQKNEIEVIWKSYQLDPFMQTELGKTLMNTWQNVKAGHWIMHGK